MSLCLQAPSRLVGRGLLCNSLLTCLLGQLCALLEQESFQVFIISKLLHFNVTFKS